MLVLPPGSIASSSLPSLLALAATPLIRLRDLDIALICIYFAMVIWIGYYLKGKSNTGEDFFMAGREKTTWIAVLSFASANPSARRSAGSKTRQTRSVDTGTPGKRPPSKSAPAPADRADNLPQPKKLQVVATGVK